LNLNKNKTKLFKIIVLFMSSIMLLSSCSLLESVIFQKGSSTVSVPKTESEKFEEFINQAFIEYVTQDTMKLHSSVSKRSALGITDDKVTLGTDFLYPDDTELADDQRLIGEFRGFDRSVLTDDQKTAYDIYEFHINEYEKGLEFFYYGNPLSEDTGLHVGLPISFELYEFHGKAEAQRYLGLIRDIPRFFDEMIGFMTIQTEKQIFMSESNRTAVLTQIDDFLKDKDSNLFITSFNTKAEGITDISADEKNSLIEENKQAFEQCVIASYEKLKAFLDGAKDKVTNNQGIAHLEKGKEYFALAAKSIGLAKTPEQLIKLVENAIKNAEKELEALPESAVKKAEEGEEISPNLKPDEMIEYLKDKAKDDFPELPETTKYELKEIDKTMRSSSRPAYYPIPPIDDTDINEIFYNPDAFSSDRDKLFFTLAHEAYPGHLEQIVRAHQVKISNFRKIMRFNAAMEGWGFYAQHYAYKYADADKDISRAAELQSLVQYFTILRRELGVNYEGWTQKQFDDVMNKELPKDYYYKDDYLKNYYQSLVNAPFSYIPYIAGYLELTELRDSYRDILKEGYSDKLFHTEYLGLGSVPFSIAKKRLDEILTVQPENTAAA